MQVYENILKYLSSFTNYELSGFDPAVKEFDLGKLKSILEKLGSPHRKFKSIHIAGTKGKGSVCSFVSSILTEAGLRVGLFTSPHLETVRERIKIGDEIISKEDFALAIHSLSEFLGSPEEDKFTPLEANLARGKTPNGAKPLTGFTFFEVLTLAAIVYFREKEVDYAVFEVGMGGRFDATNIIDAQICGISPISYDHMNALGNTIE